MALAAAGAAVALVARRGERLTQLASSIENDGGRPLVITADVAEPAQARDAVEQTVSVLGRIDTVVNNAGVMLLGPALEAPIEEWDRMLSVNLRGLLHVAHAALPHLVDGAASSPRGVTDLVNISSVAGRVARSGSAVYNMTKFGVVAFGEALRQEMSPKHVRVSAIEPGVVATELSDHIRDGVREAVRERFSKIEPLTSEDIADAILYVVTRPRRVAVNELLIRPTDQSF